ncbi:MAG: peptide-methionine (S)-S-oxide reductase MsrA [Chitinophagales bacterium]
MKWLTIIACFFWLACTGNNNSENKETLSSTTAEKQLDPSKLDTAYFAGGCFWCIEAAFEQIKGVQEAISGYAGGQQKDPSYQQVSSGMTDHAETVMVLYNPDVINYNTLLAIFFTAHDPTQLNRQGADVGKQYRSAIFYTKPEEKHSAMKTIGQLKDSDRFDKAIVTLVEPLKTFYPAEPYHQDYEEKNPDNSYIQNVSLPKIKKVRKEFPELLKEH